MHVGLIYSGATDELLRKDPELTLNLTDSEETVQAVYDALEAIGHSVTKLNTDEQLPAILVSKPFDIAFNIATGIYGDTRQANVPAILDYLNIPHTGPGVLAETICHHKPIMKLVVLAQGLHTPSFQVFHHANDELKPSLKFPVIVKLPSEGGSLGLDYESIVDNEPMLRVRLDYILNKYGLGALVEEYIDGREFTVTVLGNNPPYALPVAELVFFGKKPIRLDEPDVPTLERLKQIKGEEIPFIPMESVSVAPAQISPDVTLRLQQVAVAAYQTIGCRDWARIDMRMNNSETIYILDVNLEPGIAPDWVVNKSAAAAGWTYNELIDRILNHAVERYPHLK